MFCTKCGNELKTLREQGQLLGYCPNCNIKIKMPAEVQENTQAKDKTPLIEKTSKIAKKGFTILDEVLDKTLENRILQRKRQEQERLHQERCDKDVSIELTIIFGHQQMEINQHTYLRQKRNGVIYFDYNDTTLFRLISYQWEGAEYATVSNDQNSGSTTYKERSRRSGRGLAVGLGAAAGTILAPGIGTVIGAAAGASGPRRTKTKGKSSENTTTTARTEDIEKDTHAQLTLQNITTNEVHRLIIICNRFVDGMIRCLDWSLDD